MRSPVQRKSNRCLGFQMKFMELYPKIALKFREARTLPWHPQETSSDTAIPASGRLFLCYCFVLYKSDPQSWTYLYVLEHLKKPKPTCFKQIKNLNINLLLLWVKYFRKTKKIKWNWPRSLKDLLSDINGDECERKCPLRDNTITRLSGIWLWSGNKEFLSIPLRVSIHKMFISFCR